MDPALFERYLTEGTKGETTIIENYRDVVEDLIRRLDLAGFLLDSVDDGMACHPGFRAVKVILSVEESSIKLYKNLTIYTIGIVLGNDKAEIVADYTTDDELDRIIETHSEAWE